MTDLSNRPMEYEEALKIMEECVLSKDMREVKNSTTNGVVWDLKARGSW